MRLSILVACFLAEIWIFEKRLRVDQFWSKEVTYGPLFFTFSRPMPLRGSPSSVFHKTKLRGRLHRLIKTGVFHRSSERLTSYSGSGVFVVIIIFQDTIQNERGIGYLCSVKVRYLIAIIKVNKKVVRRT